MSKNYLDSISEIELERLTMQHKAWKPETDSFLQGAGFSSFEKIIDYGCGPGLTACDIAQGISPAAEVTGADISKLYLSHIQSVIEKNGIKNLKTIETDITNPREATEIYDGAFCRWFLAWVAKDLDVVLRNIFNSLRKGGTFAAMEYLTLRSTVSSPPNPSFDRIPKAWEEFYIQCGGTCEIGARLPDALLRAGFEIKNIKTVGGFATSGHRLFGWWKRLNEDFNQTFIEKGLLTVNQDQELKEFWEKNSKNPNAFIHTPLLVQIEAIVP